MDESLHQLFAATCAFVGGHFLLSSGAVRTSLVKMLGDGAFRGLYGVAVLAAFIWMLWSYGDAPYAQLWPETQWARYLPLLVMPFAAILLVCAFSGPNVTAVGGEGFAEAHDPSPGIMRITRHPFLWAATLWALSHMPANGDAASVMVMGGILVLALGGMAHIDSRRRATLGAAWGPIALTTSVVPFAAIAAGRTTLDWPGIGWNRVLAGLTVYLILLIVHEWIAGVSAWPEAVGKLF